MKTQLKTVHEKTQASRKGEAAEQVGQEVVLGIAHAIQVLSLFDDLLTRKNQV